MLRLIHAQTGLGGIVIDDIDDGLPNKEVHRLGSTADPKAYPRDGYANSPKQPCYIPYANPSNTAQAGYIDLNETNRVVRSAGAGKISGHSAAGNISVVSFEAAELDTPVISDAVLDTDLTIDGTTFLSILPDVTSVTITGSITGSPKTLTKAQIEAVSPGDVGATEIVIDSTLLTGIQGGDKLVVTSNSQTSNTWSLAPVISGAVLDTDLTISGHGFASDTPADTSIVLTGGALVGSPLTLTYAEILADLGTVSDTSIVVKAASFSGLAGGDTVSVTADGTTSEDFTITTP